MTNELRYEKVEEKVHEIEGKVIRHIDGLICRGINTAIECADYYNGTVLSKRLTEIAIARLEKGLRELRRKKKDNDDAA